MRFLFYLDDAVEKDPTKFCPQCESQVQVVQAHDPDATHYKCGSCNYSYAIMMCTRNEDV